MRLLRRSVAFLAAAALVLFVISPRPAAAQVFGKNKVQYEALDWSVLDSPLFALNERLPEFGESTDFQEAAFRLPAESAGQPSAPPSEPVSLPPGFAVLQLQEVVPAHAATLEEVRAQVQQDARGERGRELAREAAQRLAEAAAERRSLRSAAQAAGTSTQTSEKFTRAGSLPGIGPVKDLAPIAFSLPLQGISPAVLVGESWIVFQVTAREEADLSRLESERERLAEDLLNRKRALTWGIFRENLKKRLVEEKELKLNQAAINRLIEGR
jgi:hypothetical protein